DVFVPAPLTGDATPRSLLAVIRTQIATSTSTSSLGSLAQLGIQTQQSDGTLSLDSAKFTAALSDKKMGSQIQALFTGEGGLLSRLDKAVKPY
ncbi:flagellar filament capping protein FliD, partial [Pseudomonas viridiflava]